MDRGDDDQPVFDDAFVDAATIREADLRGAPAAAAASAAKPSKESLREVRREAKRRRSAPVGMPSAADPYAARGGPLRRAVTVVAIVAVGGGAVWGFSRLPEPRRATRQQPVVVPSFTPSPTRPANDDPFAGTKVESWPVGAQGVRAPKPVASGRFSAAQVSAAYAATARYVRAAMLDRRVLYQGKSSPVLAAIGPASAAGWKVNDFAHLATRFRPEVAPASPVVKMNGRMNVGKPSRADVLAVEFSYVGVYALRPAGDDDAVPTLVTVRRYGTFEFDARGAGVTEPWVRIASYASSHQYCGVRWPHRGYTPVHLVEPSTAAAPSATSTMNLLDPDAKPPDDCFENTGAL